MFYKDHLRLFLLAGCVALVSVNCANQGEKPALKSDAERRDLDSRQGEHRDGPGKKRKKQWSGLSYAAQTYIQLTPSASLATSGFDSELGAGHRGGPGCSLRLSDDHAIHEQSGRNHLSTVGGRWHHLGGRPGVRAQLRRPVGRGVGRRHGLLAGNRWKQLGLVAEAFVRPRSHLG